MRRPKWDLSRLAPFQKNFYSPTAIVDSRPPEEIERYRVEKEITICGQNVPKPIITFEEANLPDFLLKEFQSMGFGCPTSIQAQGWPIALSGRDMVGVAQTGSGKTLAVSFRRWKFWNTSVCGRFTT